MSTTEFDLDSFLSNQSVGSNDSATSTDDFSDESSALYPIQPGEIDPRFRQISYSGFLDLHACPRLYELNKLCTEHHAPEDDKSSITFAFGHLVGDGIAHIFAGTSWEEVVFRAFCAWPLDLFAEDEKSDKSFWSGLIALEKFFYMRQSGFLDEYELLSFVGEDGKEKPAIELGFKVSFPDGFFFRGHIDVVLRHIHTGEIIVIECKTTGLSSINPATYKNSAQAIGYSVVLDVVAPGTSSYTVYYLIYKTKGQEFEIIPFTKTHLQRAQWIREILFDIENIKMYSTEGLFPMRGESCVRFFRDCKYLNTCQLSNTFLAKPAKLSDIDTKVYDINLTLADLIDSQLSKAHTL
jgi:hypothetical protein